MNQITLVDAIIGIALIVSVLGACHRGMGREMLHTVLFAIAVAAGYVYFRTTATATTEDASFWLMNSAYYLITAYALTWLAMKLLSPLVLGRTGEIGMRSRFWAGVLCIVKLSAVIFGLNLWFAVNTNEAHPLRLNSLPRLVRESTLVQLSDQFTDEVYRWAAANNLMTYQKVVERKTAPKPVDPLDELLGISTTEPTPYGAIPASR